MSYLMTKKQWQWKYKPCINSFSITWVISMLCLFHSYSSLIFVVIIFYLKVYANNNNKIVAQVDFQVEVDW